MQGSNPAGVTTRALSSSGQSTGLRIREQQVRVLQSVPLRVSYNGSMTVSKIVHCGSNPQARAIQLRGPAGSGRLPVTQEIAGSNPVGAAIRPLRLTGQDAGLSILQCRVQIPQGSPYLHRWWNRQTRRPQKLVPVSGLRVRVPLCAPHTFLAQMAEQRSFKPQVVGSSPTGRTRCVLSSAGRAADC